MNTTTFVLVALVVTMVNVSLLAGVTMEKQRDVVAVFVDNLPISKSVTAVGDNYLRKLRRLAVEKVTIQDANGTAIPTPIVIDMTPPNPSSLNFKLDIEGLALGTAPSLSFKGSSRVGE